MARKVVYCPYCSATNGAVKKAGALKIIHDKFRAKKTADELEKWKETFAPAVEAQKELGLYINKAVHEDLNPLKVLDLFRRISDEVRFNLHTLCANLTATLLVRTVNCWVCIQIGAGQKSSFGNIFLSLQFVFVLQSLKMVLQTKTTLQSN